MSGIDPQDVPRLTGSEPASELASSAKVGGVQIVLTPHLPAGTILVSSDLWASMADSAMLQAIGIEQYDPADGAMLQAMERIKVQFGSA